MDLFSFLLSIVVIGLIFWLLFWLIDFIGLPEPFNKVAKVVLAVFAVIYLIGMLTGNMPLLPFRFK